MGVYSMTKLTGSSEDLQPNENCRLEKNQTNNLFLQIAIVPQRKRTG